MLPVRPAGRCLKHRAYTRKGKCELCMLEEDKKRYAADLEAGVIKPKIKIGKL